MHQPYTVATNWKNHTEAFHNLRHVPLFAVGFWAFSNAMSALNRGLCSRVCDTLRVSTNHSGPWSPCICLFADVNEGHCSSDHCVVQSSVSMQPATKCPGCQSSEDMVACADLLNVFETFLPQLLLYPNPSDPLNGEAAALLLREPEMYKSKVRGRKCCPRCRT